eukprot:746063-Hanusia_phi.AAC.2
MAKGRGTRIEREQGNWGEGGRYGQQARKGRRGWTGDVHFERWTLMVPCNVGCTTPICRMIVRLVEIWQYAVS